MVSGEKMDPISIRVQRFSSSCVRRTSHTSTAASDHQSNAGLAIVSAMKHTKFRNPRARSQADLTLHGWSDFDSAKQDESMNSIPTSLHKAR